MSQISGDELLAAVAQNLLQDVLLAFDAPDTISGQAHGVEHVAADLGHHGMHQMHVKTPGGVHFYHLPIGSLIIKHEGQLHGDEAKGRKLVSQGEHTFAVPKDATVHVPKDTDLTNEHEIHHADKHIVLHGPAGEQRHVNITSQGEPHEIVNADKKQHVKDALAQNFKPLPEHGTKQPVMFEGKPAAWVPSDWKLHQAADAKPGDLQAKWAKDPQGQWHMISKTGEITGPEKVHQEGTEKYFQDGKLVPDDSHEKGLPESHVEPLEHGSAKVSVGGIAVTKEEIHQALEILNSDKSTAVKQPLKAKGHPLAAMDYHGVSKEVLAKHPELKVSKGSKQAHVGQVKLTVLHHLAEQAQSFPETQAEEHVTKHVVQEAHHAAEHAQALTPATADIGGVAATKDDIEGAIKALESTKATAIKQTLAHQHNPLAGSDYWHVVKSHQAALPNTTKGMGAKAVYIHHLKQELAKLQTTDQESGHDAKVAAHELATKGEVKETAKAGEPGKLEPTLAKALTEAASSGHPVHVGDDPTGEGFEIKPSLSPDEIGYTATPEQKLLVVHPGSAPSPYEDSVVQSLLGKHVTPPPQAVSPSVVKPSGVMLKPKVPEPVLHPGEEAKGDSPELAELHELIQAAGPAPVNMPGATAGDAMAVALKLSAAGDQDLYVYPGGTGWKAGTAGLVPGTPGSPHLMFYTVHPDHTVEGVDAEGNPLDASLPTILAMAKPHLVPPQEEPQHDTEPVAEQAEEAAKPEGHAAEEAGEQVPVMTDGQVVAHFPAGAKVFAKQGLGMKYVYHDGTWTRVYANGAKEPLGPSMSQLLTQQVKEGILKEQGITEGVKALAESQSEEKVPVSIFHKVAYLAPAGSKVYYSAISGGPDKAMVKFVKLPDGSWKKIYSNTSNDVTGTTPQIYNSHVASGNLVEEGKKDLAEVPSGTGGSEEPEVEKLAEDVKPPEAPAAPEPVSGSVPVSIKGEVKYTAPPGSKVYYDTHSGLPADVSSKYVVEPDGTGKSVTSSGPSSDAYVAKQIAAGAHSYKHYKEDTGAEATPDEQLSAKLLPVLRDGALDPALADKTDFSQRLAAAAILATRVNGKTIYLSKNAEGNWVNAKYMSPHSPPEHYIIKLHPGDASITHVLAGGTSQEPVSLQTLADAMGQHVIPNAAVMSGKVYKHGFYYSPKGGKAYLEIKSDLSGSGGHYGYNSTQKYGIAARASYVWHKQDGSAEHITPTAAAKKLDTATEFHADPKPDITPVGQAQPVDYAEMPKPGGVYKMWSDAHHGPSPDHTIEMHQDGSGTLSTAGGGSAALAPGFDKNLTVTGMILDQFGTSVVKPGVKPDGYHIFGSESVSPADLKALIENLEAHYGNAAEFTGVIKAAIPGWTVSSTGVVKNAQDFLASHGAVNVATQKDAFLALFRELSEVPEGQEGDFKGVVKEPVFLKGLPPGISSAHDVFQWAPNGNAKPFGGTIAPYLGGQIQSLGSMNATQLTDKIKAVSAEFGGGKVIGTHPSALTKDEKAAWLDAFRKGNMKTIFTLDAKGGKVSPAHPGAPDNAVTHTIHWNPWDGSQVPASKEVEGTWSDLDKVTLPKAEIGNYLIKTGVQHSEYLSPTERRQLVAAHRKHEQEIVDFLSKRAAERFDNGDNPLSDAPAWTDNLQPAKSYDIHVEEKTPAAQWPTEAQTDFAADHEQELAKYAAANGGDFSFPPGELASQSSYTKYQVIQNWQDKKEAAELAEKLKPRYRLLPEQGPDVVGDQFGHQFTFTPGTAGELGHLPALSQLTSAWGFLTPRTHLAQLEDGTHGALTQRLSHASTLADVPGSPGKTDFGQLSPGEIRDIAREHVLAWALDNPTSTPGEYLRTSDGRIVNSDTTGALQDFGKWNGLAGDAKANGPAVQPSTALYDAIRNHQVSKEVADNAYAGAIQAARRMQMMPEGRIHDLLDASFGAKLAQQVADRKATLATDVDKMWDKVYKDAGWTKPEVASEALPHGLHSGFSEPTFFNHVMAGKSFGVPAFFAGPHLEDSHVHVWTELSGEGPDANRYIRGESSIRGQALQDVVAWAKAHADGAPVSSAVVSSPAAPKGELNWHTTTVGTAKKVSLHAPDQMWEGPQTKAALEKMTALKDELGTILSGAQDVIQQGPDSANYGIFKDMHGKPEMVADAASHYLDQIGKIEDAKATAGTFKPGDLPRWDAPKITTTEIEPEKQPGVKVEKRTATRILTKAQATQGGSIAGSKILGDSNELHLGDGVYSYHGSAWHITLPTGEHIEISDEAETNTYTAHAGRVRFRAVASDGSASLERIRAQLQAMGLPMQEATPDDMELFYWRHLANILADRKDAEMGSHAQVWKSLKQDMTDRHMEWDSSDLSKNVETLARSSLSAPEEQKIWRAAWSHLTSADHVNKFVEKDGFLPHQDHFDVTSPEVPNGKPYWYRFDADPEHLAQQQFPAHGLYDPVNDPKLLTSTGGMFSTEARLRALGIWKSGKSSDSDQDHGSAGFLFTRQGNETGYNNHVVLSPSVLARTSNYSYNSDEYGKIHLRKTYAHFDLAKAVAKTGSGNETMIKDGASLLDSLEAVKVYDESSRQAILAELKSKGITSIRGLPVEDRIITALNSGTITKLKAALQPSSWFSHPEVPYTPPEAEHVSKEKSAVETAEEMAGVEEGGSVDKEVTIADAAKGVQYSADHSAAAPEADVSNIFYHANSKPSGAQGQGPQVKHESAARVAEGMKSSDEDMHAAFTAAGLSTQSNWGETDRARYVAGMISTHSQGNSSPWILAMNMATHDLFKIPKESLPPLGFGAQNEETAKQLYAEHGPVVRDFVKAQWDGVQKDLGDAGINHVTLYRAFHFNDSSPEWAMHKAGESFEVPQQRPFSQWSFRKEGAETAGTFTSGGHTVIVKSTVPKEQLLAYPRSGIGCYNEGEFVVVDAPGKWEMVKS